MIEKKVLIETEDLRKYFVSGKQFLAREKQPVKAVDGVSLSVGEGETLGLVGESGCGKSTLGRLILRLIEPTGGNIRYRGEGILPLDKEKMRQLRQKLQIIFQDPYATLNPRMTIFDTVRAPLAAFGIGGREEQKEKVISLLEYVGLCREMMYRYPHEFSGGQRQRVVIARALILDPEFIVCDEPVSALDVSVQSQVLNLMQTIQRERGLSYLFISHDLSVVRHISRRVAVMYLGRIVELAGKDELFNRPLHPYTQALMSAVPVPEYGAKSRRLMLTGDVPSPIHLPSGCRFRTRCRLAAERCACEEPELADKGNGHFVACHEWK